MRECAELRRERDEARSIVCVMISLIDTDHANDETHDERERRAAAQRGWGYLYKEEDR